MNTNTTKRVAINKYTLSVITRKQSDLDRGEKMAMRWISQHMEETDHSLIDRTSMFLRFAIYIFLILICATGAEASNDGFAADRTVLEGRLLQVSKLPAPKNNPYPDCNYTAVIDQGEKHSQEISSCPARLRFT